MKYTYQNISAPCPPCLACTAGWGNWGFQLVGDGERGEHTSGWRSDHLLPPQAEPDTTGPRERVWFEGRGARGCYRVKLTRERAWGKWFQWVLCDEFKVVDELNEFHKAIF